MAAIEKISVSNRLVDRDRLYSHLCSMIILFPSNLNTIYHLIRNHYFNFRVVILLFITIFENIFKYCCTATGCV